MVPADIPADITQACVDFALRAHQVLGCKGVSCAGFGCDLTRGRDVLFLLETNTQPGMTPTSLVPEQAQKMGIGFTELCGWMIKDASCDR